MHIFKTSRSRENILSKIRKNLAGQPIPMPYPEADREPLSGIYELDTFSDEENFAEAFINAGGRFVFCDNEQQVLENILTLYENKSWKEVVCTDERFLQLFRNNKISYVKHIEECSDEADACITGCEAIVARTGSIIFSSRQFRGRTSTVYYPVHIVIAYANQVTDDIAQGLELISSRYKQQWPSMVNINTGPSRTADIEKTLVTGVHGPSEVFCFLVDAEK